MEISLWSNSPPSPSKVILRRYGDIQERLAKFGDPADVKNATRVFEAVRKNDALIVYRKPHWHGRLYIPDDIEGVRDE